MPRRTPRAKSAAASSTTALVTPLRGGARPPPEPPAADDPRAVATALTDVVARAQEMVARVAMLLRSLWIVAHRNYVSARTRRPCTYRSSPRWDGGIDAQGRRYQPVWPAVALLACRQGLDPYTLVNAQFAAHAGVPPHPNVMKSQRGLDNYRLYRKSILPELAAAYKSQDLALRLAVFSARALYPDEARLYTAVLYDPDVQLTALFRYCQAVRLGLTAVAIDWRQQALEQYLGEPSYYDEVWRDDIPGELRVAAAALARDLAGVELGKVPGNGEETD